MKIKNLDIDTNIIAVSSYNEGTNEQLDYYLDESKCSIKDRAYVYSYEDDETKELEIVQIIARSNNQECYDSLILNENILLDGERKYNADTSAELITDNDCYLVWFKEI